VALPSRDGERDTYCVADDDAIAAVIRVLRPAVMLRAGG